MRPWRVKHRILLPLYDPVLEALNFDLDKPDELLICRLHAPFLSVRVARPEKLFAMSPLHENALPPAWPARTKVGGQ